MNRTKWEDRYTNRKPPAAEPVKRNRTLTRQSRKRKTDDATYNAIRDVYLENNGRCVLCGGEASQVHHICRGANRRRSLLNSDTYLAACQACHDLIERMPVAEQIKLKQRTVKETIERLRR